MGAKQISKLTINTATVVVLLLGLCACKKTTVIDEYRQAPKTAFDPEESVVVLGRRHSSQYETEIDFISCLGESLSDGKNGINVIPEKEFVDGLYPYFETSTAPMDIKNLDKLAQNPIIARKFSELQIRYFIWIDGFTERTDERGGISCGISLGGGGCFGFTSWEDQANYEASIWDFKNLQMSGKINAETQGTSYLPAVIVPIPLLARVQAGACENMAEQIKHFIQ